MRKGMIKKRISGMFAIGLFVISIISGCSRSTDSGSDLENTEILDLYSISQNAALRNDRGEYLRYIDIENEQVKYFCNKPACLHMDKTCGAYFKQMLDAFFYQGKLYVLSYGDDLTGLTITICDTSGENRQEITVKEPIIFSESFQQLYDGHIYMLGSEFTDSKKSETVKSICAVSLADGSVERLVVADDMKEGFSWFRIEGDDLVYISSATDTDMKEFLQEDLIDPDWDKIHFQSRINVYNRTTQDTDVICEVQTTGLEGADLLPLCVKGEDVYYRYGTDICCYSIPAKETQVVSTLPEAFHNKEMMYGTDIGEGMIMPLFSPDGDHELVWFDENFQVKETISFDEFPYASCLGRCEDKLWFQNENTIFYILVNDFLNHEYNVHTMPEL